MGGRSGPPARDRGRRRGHGRLLARRPRRLEPAARGRVRHQARRVLAGRDPHRRPEPAARRPHHRQRQRGRRDRPVHGRRPDHARPAPLGHDRRSLRLGRGRSDHGRRHQLDGDRDREGDTCCGGDASAVGGGLPRVHAHRASGRRAAGRAGAALAAGAAAGECGLARCVHGLHRGPAHVPRRRSAHRGVRAPGGACHPRSEAPGSCCSALRSASSA